MTKAGASADELSLPPGTSGGKYYEYEVVKPITAIKSIIAPWGGSLGGGTQFKLKDPILELIKNGSLKLVEVKK